MKIAFDHQIFSFQQYGGVSRYFYELGVEMATSCEQEVAVISALYVNRYLANAPYKLDVVGVHAPRLQESGRIYGMINSFLAWPTMRYFQPDIVHETYYSSRRTAPQSAKVVLTVYDMIHERFNDYFSKDDSTSQTKALAVARADHVICISEQTRQDLVELLGVDPAKTSVVHLGCGLTHREESKRKLDSASRPFLLYVGFRVGYKNFERLLQAYAASSTLRNDFDLVCFGGGELTSKEKSLFHRLGLPIESVRHVSGDDGLLAGYYRAASAFIYPSLYEGFGIPLLEAMSLECPIVCSCLSSIPEVVGNAGEMFDPHEIDSIRIAIERVVNDDALRELLISRGKERSKLFSWKRCAQETFAVYWRLLS